VLAFGMKTVKGKVGKFADHAGPRVIEFELKVEGKL
jgi:hypothetical protein